MNPNNDLFLQKPGSASTAVFPNPFLDYSTMYMPRTMEEVFDWAEYLWVTNGTYKTALQRVVRYFITDIVIEGTKDSKERDKYRKMLIEDIQILTQLTDIGDDTISVGNSFTSLYEPFDRVLICKGCAMHFSIEQIDFKFELTRSNGKFTAKCDACGYSGVFDHKDHKSVDPSRYKVIRWNPREIKLRTNIVSGETVYYWRIPETLKKEIQAGDKFSVATTNWEIIECIQKGFDFKFLKGKLMHCKETTIASVKAGGWGLPKVVSVLKQAWYVQVLHRQNEAIAQDYILPFRVISPAPGPSSAVDPLLSMDMGNFMSQVQSMLAEHRKDPATYHTCPTPLNYQSLGAEGSALVTPQLLQNGIDNLLNSLSVPVEMYNGNLKVVGSPLALRLFERMHSDLASGLNNWLRWLVGQLGEAMGWEKVTCSLRSPTIAEDLDRKQLLVQLKAAGQVSDETALAPWGIDAKEEKAKIRSERRDDAEEELREQRENAPSEETQQVMDMNVQQQRQAEMIEQGIIPDPNAQQEGGAPAQGAPAPAGPQNVADVASGQNQSIYDMDAKAQELAQQLLSMDESSRRSQMLSLKKSDETLHALVKQKMQNMRTQATVPGRDAALQQQLGTPQQQA